MVTALPRAVLLVVRKDYVDVAYWVCPCERLIYDGDFRRVFWCHDQHYWRRCRLGSRTLARRTQRSVHRR